MLQNPIVLLLAKAPRLSRPLNILQSTVVKKKV